MTQQEGTLLLRHVFLLMHCVLTLAVAVKGGLGENVDAGFVEMVLLLWQGASAGR